ncbi:hypothetical protein BC835DRAFT_851743 [Cytidiella melzeri]|nr:hypothetical protein BC835DRAFT_851743 [Cytidiella melzeri]
MHLCLRDLQLLLRYHPLQVRHPTPFLLFSLTRTQCRRLLLRFPRQHQPPTSTFSSPVFVTRTDAKGNLTPSLPPVITSVGVSTEPDGVLVSVTQIIANPTGIWGIGDSTQATKHGFLANGGAVAGVFVVVGIIVTAIAAIFTFISCKRRRRRRIRLSISRPLPMPDNPFEDPRESPSPTRMRYAPSDTSDRNLIGRGLGVDTQPPRVRHLLDDEFEEVPGPATTHAAAVGTGFAGVGAGGKSVGRPTYDGTPSYNGPFSEYAVDHRPTHLSKPSNASSAIGVAITSDEVHQATSNGIAHPTPRRIKHASLTPSTPSIYPPSLPAVDDGDTTTEDSHGSPITPSTDEGAAIPLGLGLGMLAQSTEPARPPRKRPAPPIPPRSPLRPSSAHFEHPLTTISSTQLPPHEPTKTGTVATSTPHPDQYHYEPLTPPASVSSFSSEVAMPRAVVARPSPSNNPFEEYNRMMSRTGIPLVDTKMKDTFYTRRKLVNPDIARRTSVEWRA